MYVNALQEKCVWRIVIRRIIFTQIKTDREIGERGREKERGKERRR